MVASFPGPAGSSLAVRNSRRGPGLVHHVIRAAGRVFTSHQIWPRLASFPGSCVGGEKRAWYTLFAHAQFPLDFWEFGNFRKICSVTLTSARHADFSRIKDACH